MPIPLTAIHLKPWAPPNLAKVDAAKPEAEQRKIVIRVPNMYERDNFSSALVRAGVIHYGQKEIRDLVLAGITLLWVPEEFDAKRDLLEQAWQAQDAAMKCQEERQNRFLELLQLHQAKLERDPGTPPFDQAAAEAELELIQPDVQVDESVRVRATALQQDIAARYAPLQQAFADLAEQDIKRRWLCIQTYVANWQNFEHSPTGNGMGGITRDEAMWLRSQIGQADFDAVGELIFAMHGLDSDDEKNLDSLIVSFSDQTGSTASEKMSEEIPSGNSKVEPTTEIPAEESQPTTARSSRRSKPSGTRKGKSASSPTDAPSSNNP